MPDTPNEPKMPDNIIFDHSPFPMWIYDLETLAFLAVNREAIAHYGYSEKEFLGMTIRDIRPAEDIHLLEEAVEKVRRGEKQTGKGLFRHRLKDGTIILVKIKSNLITYRGRQAEIVSAIDLTESHQQRQYIEKQKRHLATIRDTQEILLKSRNWPNALKRCFEITANLLGADSLYFFNVDGGRYHLSEAICWSSEQKHLEDMAFALPAIIQFPPCKLSVKKGKSFLATYPEVPEKYLQSALAIHDIKCIFVTPVMLDEEIVGIMGMESRAREIPWQKLDFQLLETLAGNLSHTIKEAISYKKLEDSESRFRSLVQNGTDLIALIDENGNYQYVAPTSTKVLGIPPEAFIGKNAFDFIFPEDMPRVKKQLESIGRKGHISVDPYRFSDAKGNWVWLHTELSDHLDDPSINGIIANTQVVTDEMEKRMTSELIAAMSHSLARSQDLSKGIDRALAKTIRIPGIACCEFWLVSKDRQQLNLISKSYSSGEYAKLYSKGHLDSLEKGQGLPGKSWTAKDTGIWDDLPNEPLFVRKKPFSQTPLKSAISIPIYHSDRFLGVFLAFSTELTTKLKSQIRLLKAVFHPLGAVIQQKLTEEEYRNFFDLSPGPLCVIGFDGHIKKCNRALQRLLGYHKSELVGSPLIEFVYEGDNFHSRDRMVEFLARDTQKPQETKFLTKKGKVISLIWKGKAMPEPKVIIAVAKDITAQKNAQAGLKEAYNKLKNAQKIGKLGYWSRDISSDVSEWSDETYRIYGYSRKEFEPNMENLIGTFHPEDKSLLENDPLRGLKPGKVSRFEHRIINGKGKTKWVQQEIKLITDKEGTPVRLEGTIRDITEQKEHEQKLSISNNRFKLAMKVSNEMIWELDCHTGIILRGTKLGKEFGYKETESFTMENSWFQKVHPEDAESVWKSFQHALANKTIKSWKKEYRLIITENKVSHVVDRCLILRDKTGKAVRAVGSVLDVTSSRRQLQKITLQNEHLKEIAWLQSHRIRAPLSRIMGLISLSREADRDEVPLEQLFDWIESSCEELDRVVHEITAKTIDGNDPENS